MTNTDKLETPYEEKPIGSIDLVAPVPDALEEVDPVESAKVRRKVDFCLLPLLCTVYALQFLDKTCISSASVMGFRSDLHLTGDQYAWLGSIFYLGYLVGEYPLNIGLQKFPLAKYTAVMIILWGAILCLMAVGGSFRNLMVIRFFLGFFESIITPALTIFTSQYYKASEQGTRTGIWFSFNASGSIVGGALAYGLLHGQKAGTLSIAGWKLVFIILGAFTSFVGILFLVWIPDSPQSARFLNAREKEVAMLRVASNKTGSHSSKLKPEQIKEALLDPMTWLYSAVGLLTSIPNGGITNFFAILIQGFGFSTYDTLLLGMANSWLAIIMIFTLWLGDKTKNRCLAALFPCTVSIIGSSLVWKLPAHLRIGRLIGFYLTLPFVIPMPVVLSFISSNVAGRTKKTVVSATFLVAYCVGNLIGPQTFRASDAPTYAPALATIVGCNVAVLLCMVAIRMVYTRRNAKVDESAPQAEDMTDRTNKAFRYTM